MKYMHCLNRSRIHGPTYAYYITDKLGECPGREMSLWLKCFGEMSGENVRGNIRGKCPNTAADSTKIRVRY